MRRRISEEEEEFPIVDHTGWMVPFSDLITLLLTFFVLLFSMSSIGDKQLKNALSTISGGTGVLEMSGSGEISPYSMAPLQNISPAELAERLNEIMKRYQEDRLDKVAISSVENVVSMVLPIDILFDSGAIDVKPEMSKALADLSAILKGANYSIKVEGHTDDTTEKKGGGYSSSWDLSAMRAVNIMKFFSKEGIQEARLSAAGYGMYKPLFPNSSAENRQKNRRVMIILEKRFS